MPRLTLSLCGGLIAAILPFGALAQGEPVTVADGNGRELTFAAPPERIVCLLNRCAQELAFVGGPVPVAFGAPYTLNVALDPLNFGPAAEGAVAIDQTDGVDFEAVVAARPDLVIGELDMEAAAEGIAPLYSLNWDEPATVDAFLTDVRAYARILGRVEETEVRIAAVLDRVEAYARLAPGDRSVAVLSFADEASFWIPPNCGLFLSRAATCARDEPGGEWIQATTEALLAYSPETIVIEDYGTGEDAQRLDALSDDPLWPELAAVKAGEVHLLPVSQARANTIASVEAMMDAVMPLLYPDTFPAPLTDEQVAAALARD